MIFQMRSQEARFNLSHGISQICKNRESLLHLHFLITKINAACAKSASPTISLRHPNLTFQNVYQPLLPKQKSTTDSEHEVTLLITSLETSFYGSCFLQSLGSKAFISNWVNTILAHSSVLGKHIYATLISLKKILQCNSTS